MPSSNSLSPKLQGAKQTCVIVVPSQGVLTVGIDPCHPRFTALTGGKQKPGVSTSSIQGCIDLVQGAVRQTLGREAQLGDSFVELGLDSMSSMSLHSAISQSSGSASLPTSIFYDHPTILSVAKLVHQQAKAANAQSGFDAMEDEVNAELLDSADARQSYHLSLAREALARKDFEEVRRQCQQCRSAQILAGLTHIAVLRLETEACQGLGLLEEWRLAAEAVRGTCNKRREPAVIGRTGVW